MRWFGHVLRERVVILGRRCKKMELSEIKRKVKQDLWMCERTWSQ